MSERKDPIVIAAAVRTPLGRFQGELAPLSGPRLGATVIRAAVERAGIDGARVDEVLMGCVLPAGQGQAPAPQPAPRPAPPPPPPPPPPHHGSRSPINPLIIPP